MAPTARSTRAGSPGPPLRRHSAPRPSPPVSWPARPTPTRPTPTCRKKQPSSTTTRRRSTASCKRRSAKTPTSAAWRRPEIARKVSAARLVLVYGQPKTPSSKIRREVIHVPYQRLAAAPERRRFPHPKSLTRRRVSRHRRRPDISLQMPRDLFTIQRCSKFERVTGFRRSAIAGQLAGAATPHGELRHDALHLQPTGQVDIQITGVELRVGRLPRRGHRPSQWHFVEQKRHRL